MSRNKNREATVTNWNELDQHETKLIDLMNDGVFIAQDYHFIYANPALLTMLGYHQEEFIKLNFESIVAPEYLSIWIARYKDRIIGNKAEPLGRYEVQFLRKGGDERIWLELQAKRIQYSSEPAVLGVVRDVTHHKQLLAELERLSQTDALTGLANRNRLTDLLGLAIQNAARRHERLAILYLDLDDFKKVNDTRGHAAGDWLLRQVSERLLSSLRAVDIVSRIGGDEFVIVLTEIRDYEDTKKVAAKILEQFSTPYQYENHMLTIGTSIGISHYPDNGLCNEELIRKADAALYQVKASGKFGFRICGVGE